MPISFPQGQDQSINPTVTPNWAFTPPSASVTSTCRFNNTGRWPVYIGGIGVTQYTGLPLMPGSKPIELVNVTQTLYVASAVGAPVVQGTVGATAYTAGTTAITLSAAVPAGLAAGTYILIGNTANTNAVQAQLVATTTASSQLTFANPLTLDVANGDVVYSGTFQPGQVRVTGGIV